jgi:hypothetical protein
MALLLCCDINFASFYGFKQHLKEHFNKNGKCKTDRMKCPLCPDKSYVFFNKLITHIYNGHRENVQSQFLESEPIVCDSGNQVSFDLNDFSDNNNYQPSTVYKVELETMPVLQLIENEGNDANLNNVQKFSLLLQSLRSLTNSKQNAVNIIAKSVVEFIKVEYLDNGNQYDHLIDIANSTYYQRKNSDQVLHHRRLIEESEDKKVQYVNFRETIKEILRDDDLRTEIFRNKFGK